MGLVIFVWLAMAVITGLAAQARGRYFIAWFVWGGLFSVFALLAVLVMRNKREEQLALSKKTHNTDDDTDDTDSAGNDRHN